MKAVDPFYTSKQWRETRAEVFKRDKYRCQSCNALCLGSSKGKPSPHCDHKIERKTRPDLAYTLSNMQTLCGSCHSRKTRADESNRPYIGVDGYIMDEIG